MDKQLQKAAMALSQYLDNLHPPKGSKERVRHSLRRRIHQKRRRPLVRYLLVFISTSAVAAMAVDRWIMPSLSQHAPPGSEEKRLLDSAFKSNNKAIPEEKQSSEFMMPHLPHKQNDKRKKEQRRKERSYRPNKNVSTRELPNNRLSLGLRDDSTKRQPSIRLLPPELTAQVEAYQKAMALQSSDLEGALAAWIKMRKRWPKGVLRHENDLHIIATLLQMGRIALAQKEARSFIAHYPKSPKRSEVQGVLTIQAKNYFIK